MKIGYVRVSTEDQNLDFANRRTLNKSGCEKIFTDYGMSGIAVLSAGWSGNDTGENMMYPTITSASSATSETTG